MQQDKQIFLDCGAWNGTSVDFFLEHYPEADEFEIHSFECLPDNIELLKNKQTNAHEYAVWTSNGHTRLYTGLTESGSIYKEKTSGGLSPTRYIDVNTIDIAEFIKNNFTKDDYIIMKLNVEGAEYDILPHMLKEGILDWIDEWYIQWHWNKIKLNKTVHDKVSSLVKWNPWLAMHNDKKCLFKYK